MENIAILNLYDNGIISYAPLTERINKTYAKKHGYEYIKHLGLIDNSRPPNWSKILFLLESMNARQDITWFWWLDSDAIITDINKSLDEVMSGVTADDFLLLSKLGGNINTGSFLIKNCDTSKRFLNDIYNETDYIYCNTYEEAAASILVQQDQYKNIVKYVPPELLNAGPNIWTEGWFVLHLYGAHFDETIIKHHYDKYFEK
jgi:hypothetical protein